MWMWIGCLNSVINKRNDSSLSLSLAPSINKLIKSQVQRDIVHVGGDAFRVCGRNFAGLKIILINLDLMQYSMSLIALASHFSFGWMEITIFVKKKKKKKK